MPKPEEKTHKSELKLSRKGKTVRLEIEGVIGWGWFGTTYREFKQQLKEKAKGANTIEVEINSPGGVITEGMAIYNLLVEQEATVHTYVVGQAASMGSVILMAGDRIFVPNNAMPFIHKPISGVQGNADDMRKTADDLDKFEGCLTSAYQRHFKGTDEELAELMRADSFLTADEMEDKFNNVTVMRHEVQAVACEHFEYFEASEQEPKEREDSALFKQFCDFMASRKKKPQPKNKEADMPLSKEETDALTKSITASVVEALKPTEEPKPKAETPKTEPIAFVGDKTSKEDVEKHQAKLKQAQMEASVDWSDPASVKAYQDAVFGAETPKGSNTDSEQLLGKGTSTKRLTREEAKAETDRLCGLRG